MINITYTKLEFNGNRVKCAIYAEDLGHLGWILDSAGLYVQGADYQYGIQDIAIEVTE